MMSAIRDWLRSCPLIDQNDRFCVDWLDAEPLAYAIEETPNTASWYVNGSFLSAWYSSVDAEELPASAAAFVEMSREPAFEGGDGSGAAMG